MAAVVITLATTGCGKEKAGLSTTPDPAAETDDWGDDWLEVARGDAPAPSGGGPGSGTVRRTGGGTVWAIVLATFGSEASSAAAVNTVNQLRSTAPELADVWMHTTDKGSMVLYGHYDGADSQAAQDDLKMIKTFTMQDRPVFVSAYLSRVNLGPTAREQHPFALKSVRRRYPNLDPLYTLEVAVWGDFESGELTVDEIQDAAEAYARKLRVQGHEAYFFHDGDKQMSMVTVGLFDQRAIDARTGLFSPEVDMLLRQFDAHLVNGEPLLEPIDGRDPDRGLQVQKPRLVYVPKR